MSAGRFVIVALVVALLFGALGPTIADEYGELAGEVNVTGASQTMVGLLFLFIAVGVLIYTLKPALRKF